MMSAPASARAGHRLPICGARRHQRLVVEPESIQHVHRAWLRSRQVIGPLENLQVALRSVSCGPCPPTAWDTAGPRHAPLVWQRSAAAKLLTRIATCDQPGSVVRSGRGVASAA